MRVSVFIKAAFFSCSVRCLADETEKTEEIHNRNSYLQLFSVDFFGRMLQKNDDNYVQSGPKLASALF